MKVRIVSVFAVAGLFFILRWSLFLPLSVHPSEVTAREFDVEGRHEGDTVEEVTMEEEERIGEEVGKEGEEEGVTVEDVEERQGGEEVDDEEMDRRGESREENTSEIDGGEEEEEEEDEEEEEEENDFDRFYNGVGEVGEASQFCNASVTLMKYMSTECRKLWRPDVTLRRFSPERFHYLHIPKGGAPFTTVLRNYVDQCKKKDVACVHESMTQEELSCGGRLSVCNGHQPWQRTLYNMARREKVEENVPTVTMLRDPLARIASAKEHNCHRDNGSRGPMTLPKECEEMSLVEFAQLNFIQGCQTKMLTGYYCGEEIDFRDTSVHRAKESLHMTDFVGLADYWELSVKAFHCQFGKELRPSELPSTTRTSRSGPLLAKLTRADRKQIKGFEVLDEALYKYAKELFKKRFECLKCSRTCV